MMLEIYLIGKRTERARVEASGLVDGFLEVPYKERDIDRLLGYHDRMAVIQDKMFAVVGVHGTASGVSHYLHSRGYNGVSYVIPETALGAFQQLGFDIFFAEVDLPGMDCVEFARRLREMKKLKVGAAKVSGHVAICFDYL